MRYATAKFWAEALDDLFGIPDPYICCQVFDGIERRPTTTVCVFQRATAWEHSGALDPEDDGYFNFHDETGTWSMSGFQFGKIDADHRQVAFRLISGSHEPYWLVLREHEYAANTYQKWHGWWQALQKLEGIRA